MEIKTEADDVDESPGEVRPMSVVVSASHWTSPRIRKKLRAATNFHKHIN